VNRYWCERAVLPGGVATGVLVEQDGGAITSVVAGVDWPVGAHRLPGLVFPGFANAHSHAFHRALRGRTHADGGTFWTWRDAMYRVAARLDPDRYFRLARLVFAEMAVAGYTCVGEFHYVHHQPDGTPYADPNAMGSALIEAAREAGIRITLLDTGYLVGGLDADGYVGLAPAQIRFGDGDVDHWARRFAALASGCAAPHARIGAAVHSVRAVPDTTLPVFAAVTDGYPVHVHLSEQFAENQACQAFHGRSPTRLLADAGLLRPSTTFVHATYLSDVDITLLGASGAGVCCCPTTEADLADGIGPMGELAHAGAALALGSDQHAVIDPFAEVRGLEYGERLRTGWRGRFTPAQLTRIATENGHRCLGWPDAGRIAAGAVCDLVAVRLDSPNTAGARPDQVVLTATAADVDTVVASGRVVARSGRHTSIPHAGPAMIDVIEELMS
jgi:formiminoglutamate deiminase